MGPSALRLPSVPDLVTAGCLDAVLTPRETEVLTLIGQGLSNQEIAAHCCLSINTIKSQIRVVYRKMSVTRRSEAVAWAIQNELATFANPIQPQHSQTSGRPRSSVLAVDEKYVSGGHGSGFSTYQEGLVSARQHEAVSRVPTTPQTRVGKFSYDTAAGVWDWDDEVFRIHGAQPSSNTVTTEHLLACQHPEDRARVSEVLVRAAHDGKPSSVSYRLTAVDGGARRALIVCEGELCAGNDSVTTIKGYFIDLTEGFGREITDAAPPMITEPAPHRAVECAHTRGQTVVLTASHETSVGGEGHWPGRSAGLSSREAAILALVTQGLSNRDVAARAFIGMNSVKTYIRSAYRKINVTSRTQAVIWALENGFSPTLSVAPLTPPSSCPGPPS